MKCTKNYQVEKAVHADGAAILAILKERASWLKDSGSTQWSFLMTGQEDKEILAFVEQGCFYKVIDEGRIIAAFMLSDKQEQWDIHLWGEEENEKILYLHKLTVAMSHKGKHLGDYLINWIKEQAASRKMASLRLDCVAQSDKLNAFYRGHGFVLLKIIDDHCLYEWDVR